MVFLQNQPKNDVGVGRRVTLMTVITLFVGVIDLYFG